MKASKKWIVGATSAALVASAIVPVASAASFSDIENSDHKDAILALAEAGIISGYTDGTFKPNAIVTRGNVAKLLGKWLVSEGYEIPADFNTVERFTDLPTDSADQELVKYAALVKEAGVFKGSNNKLMQTNNMTREQMAVVLVRALKTVYGVDLVADYKAANFESKITDLEKATADENREAIIALEYAELTTVTTFNPKNSLTRGQFASFLNRAITKVAPAEETEVKLVSFEAVKVKELEVKFSTPVDTTKATMVVKKGNVVVNVDKIDFSEDKKSAIITTTSKLTKGDYTVVVSGLTEKELTSTVTVADEKVSKINVLSTTAPLNPKAVEINSVKYGEKETAFVNYEVLNQYGEKMTGQTINWNLSTGGGVLDNSTTGQLTIGNTSGGVKFVPGNKVYLTGVHSTTATVVNAEVTIGLEAKAAVAEIKGVYNSAKNKMEDLPAGFASDKYLLLFQVKDQYGNVIDSPTLSELTYLSDNPLFVVAPTTADASTVTVDEVTYQAVKLVPGANAAKGGTANIQIISNNTGNVAKYTITANALEAVTNFKISAPEELIAGKEKVEIPFTAVDQYGNAVTKYSALNGKVNLTATDGGIFAFEQQKDGSAKLFYTAKSNTTQYDSVVSLTSLVPTNGDYSNVQVQVKPNAEPAAIIGLSTDIATKIASGNQVTAKGEDLLVQDQYGRTLTKDQINTWLDESVSNGDNAFVIESTVGNTTPFEVTSTVTSSDAALVEVTGSKDKFVINANASVANTLTSLTEKLVFSLSTASTPTAITTSSKSVTFTRVAQSEYVSYEVADLGKMYNDAKTTTDSVDVNYNVAPKVYGITEAGAKVLLPASQYTISTDAKLAVNGGEITDVTSAGYTSDDFKDNAGNAKDITVKVTILVHDSTGAAAASIEKDLIISNETPVATTITLDSKKVTNGSAFVEHSTGEITATNLNAFVKEIKDQYGVVIKPAANITISSVTKVEGSTFTVASNAANNVAISGAKAGDKFTATFKYAGGKSEVINFVVAD